MIGEIESAVEQDKNMELGGQRARDGVGWHNGLCALESGVGFIKERPTTE